MLPTRQRQYQTSNAPSREPGSSPTGSPSKARLTNRLSNHAGLEVSGLPNSFRESPTMLGTEHQGDAMTRYRKAMGNELRALGIELALRALFSKAGLVCLFVVVALVWGALGGTR